MTCWNFRQFGSGGWLASLRIGLEPHAVYQLPPYPPLALLTHALWQQATSCHDRRAAWRLWQASDRKHPGPHLRLWTTSGRSPKHTEPPAASQRCASPPLPAGFLTRHSLEELDPSYGTQQFRRCKDPHTPIYTHLHVCIDQHTRPHAHTPTRPPLREHRPTYPDTALSRLRIYSASLAPCLRPSVPPIYPSPHFLVSQFV